MLSLNLELQRSIVVATNVWHDDVQVPQSKAVPAKEKDFQTLHEYEAHKEASQPKGNAWGARNNAARSGSI